MSGILFSSVAIGLVKVHSIVQERRSPRLPLPPSDSGLGELAKHGSVRQLKTYFHAWQYREESLQNRVRALKAAHARGVDRCWAGSVEDLRTVRQARNEAKWVRQRLGDALEWCKTEEGVRKQSVLKLHKGRPCHSAIPPSLFQLPSPLPEALPSDDFTLTVDRSRAVEPPPAYRLEVADDELIIGRTSIDLTNRDRRV